MVTDIKSTSWTQSPVDWWIWKYTKLWNNWISCPVELETQSRQQSVYNQNLQAKWRGRLCPVAMVWSSFCFGILLMLNCDAVLASGCISDPLLNYQNNGECSLCFGEFLNYWLGCWTLGIVIGGELATLDTRLTSPLHATRMQLFQ